jgi:hypothetical protein
MCRLLLKKLKLVAMNVEETTIQKILSMKNNKSLSNLLFLKMDIAMIADLKNSLKLEMLQILKFCKKIINNKKMNY